MENDKCYLHSLHGEMHNKNFLTKTLGGESPMNLLEAAALHPQTTVHKPIQREYHEKDEKILIGEDPSKIFTKMPTT